jgi:hypothetical protein
MKVSNTAEERFADIICQIKDPNLFYALAQALFRKIARKQLKLLNDN